MENKKHFEKKKYFLFRTDFDDIYAVPVEYRYLTNLIDKLCKKLNSFSYEDPESHVAPIQYRYYATLELLKVNSILCDSDFTFENPRLNPRELNELRSLNDLIMVLPEGTNEECAFKHQMSDGHINSIQCPNCGTIKVRDVCERCAPAESPW